MTGFDLSRARAHDLGGRKAGPIDRRERELEPWHNLVTAILNVLRDERHQLLRVDEMRRAIEDMPSEDYLRLGYFDKWAVGVAALLVEKGIMARAEIDGRVAELARRVKPRAVSR